MSFILSYIVTGWLFSSIHFIHPVHVALTSIDYSVSNKNIDIAVKLNTEDIELAIAHNYNIILNLNKANESAEFKKHILNYFTHTLQVYVNDNNKLPLTFNKKSEDDGFTWFYFSFPYTNDITKITVKNAILCDIFMDQTNITILSDNGKESGFRLDFNNRELNYIPHKLAQ